MKRTDRLILLVIPAIAAVAAFYMLVLSPKRDEASELAERVTQLQQEAEAAEQAADLAEASSEEFPDLYRAVVRLGKAVPEDDDTAALLYQLTRSANKAKVNFRTIELDAAAAAAPAPPPPPPPDDSGGEDGEGEDGEEGEDGQDGEGDAAPTPGATPVATEALASALPIGATVGPAGFPVMPYQVQVRGSFFRIADFLREVDRLVSLREDGTVAVRGRLLTIDGFSLAPNQRYGFPTLTGTVRMTSYVLDPSEGLTAGATPAGPVPGAEATPTPTAGGTP